MKTLINKIIIGNDLNVISLEENIDFAYYNSKEDFFIFFFCTYEQLIDLNNGEIKDLEYILNSIIVQLKEKDGLLPFKERYIDHNLSFILVLRLDQHEENIINELNKVQENNINAKKYILPYNENDLIILKEKISEQSPIVEELNRVSIDNSNSLKDKEQSWYKLLITLFIKIPFLNYLSEKEEHKLGNISEALINKLSEKEANILSIINEMDFDKYSNIEDFLLEHKLIHNGDDEI